jgi:hypothetical protein
MVFKCPSLRLSSDQKREICIVALLIQATEFGEELRKSEGTEYITASLIKKTLHHPVATSTASFSQDLFPQLSSTLIGPRRPLGRKRKLE